MSEINQQPLPQLDRVMEAVTRFCDAAEQYEGAVRQSQASGYTLYQSKHRATVKRASMDLTRELANIRRPGIL